jgi:hypothetical protein
MFVTVHEYDAAIRSTRIYIPSPHFDVVLPEPYVLAHLAEIVKECIHKTFNVVFPLLSVKGIPLAFNVDLQNLRDRTTGAVHVYCRRGRLAQSLGTGWIATFSLTRQAERVISLRDGKVSGAD